jgi:hypothetical protein
MTRIIGIYNADGSILGELKFAVNKVTGKSNCGLCDLTHGWNPLGKSSWKRASSSSHVEIELLHRNELTTEQSETAGDLPAIIVEKVGEWKKIMSADDIFSFSGNASGFLTQIETLVDEA